MDWNTVDLEGRRQDKKEAEKTNLEEGTTRMGGGGEEDRLIRIVEELGGQEVERDEYRQTDNEWIPWSREEEDCQIRR